MAIPQIYYSLRDHYRTKAQKKEASQIIHRLPARYNLNGYQKREITSFFEKNIGVKTRDYIWHELYASINGNFDVRYIPINAVFQKIISKLNMECTRTAYSDKNFYDTLFNDFKRPLTILKRWGGDFYIDNRIVAASSAMEILKNYEKVVIKPTLESGQGHGVKILSTPFLLQHKTDYLITEFGDNFIIQEPLLQHPVLSNFNPSSLNTIRMVSYREGSRVYIVNATLKIGKSGEIVDNGHAGGYFVGINQDGSLKETIYSLNPFSKNELTQSNLKTGGIQLPSYARAKDMVREMALRLPYHKIVGWDIAIAKDGQPTLIELNINGFGVNIIQIPNGPLLGDYTEQILQKLK